jgi:hypothetical protein
MTAQGRELLKSNEEKIYLKMEKFSDSIAGVIFLLIFLMVLIDFLIKGSSYEILRLSVSLFLYIVFISFSVKLRILRKKFKSSR